MGGIGCNANGYLDDTKFSQPIPWIGIYIAAASLACLVGMAADTIHGILHRKFWFPSKYVALNATTLTLIAVAVKLSLDLNTPMPGHHDQLAKLSSSALVCTIMGNSLPSLGDMENKEIAMNVMAMAILVITIIANICIQLATGVIYVFWKEHALIMFLMLILLLMMASSALTVPKTKHYLELKYKKKYEMAIKECAAQTEGTLINKFREKLMKYWMMAHTSSPQFVMGRSATCIASGAFCLLGAMILAEAILRSYFMPWSFRFCTGKSDYKWSSILILVVQCAAVGVGTVAPVFRWFIAIIFRCPKVRNKSTKGRFEVEHYWIESLAEMKECPLNLPILDRHHRKIVHDVKIFCLNFCIRMQIGTVLMSKVIQLISVSLVCWIFACCSYAKRLKSKFNKSVPSVSSGTASQSVFKLDISRFVLHLPGEEELVEVMMRNNCDATNQWIQVGEKKQPKHIIELLEKSSILQGFKGVEEFDSDQVPSLHAEEPPNIWSLPLVTLTSIAVALPNISKNSAKKLISTLHEGLHYVKVIENHMDKEGDVINIRKAAEIVWLGVDLYHKWLDVDLHKLSLQDQSPKETLERLADIAKTRYETFKNKSIHVCLKESPSRWPSKLLAANSMFRLSQTALLSCERRSLHTSEQLFEELTVQISDILGACLTNLTHVISEKCLNSAIEERQKSVRQAVYLLGKTKKIIEMLNKRTFFVKEYLCQITNIDEWRSMHKQKNPFTFIPSSLDSNSETSSKSSDLYLTIE